MLIDRHRTAAVIALSRVPEAERVAHQDALENLLVHLYQNATTAAREAFRERMDPVPASQKLWGALTRPNPAQWIGLGPPVPPVLVLLLGQQDDDPDSAEDGNRLSDRDSNEGAPWIPLYAALDRWDTAAILRHIGPTGWQLPAERLVPPDEGFAVERVPASAAPMLIPTVTPPMSPAIDPNTGQEIPGPLPKPGNGAPGNGNSAPGNVTPDNGNTGAGTGQTPADLPFWRRPRVLIAGGVAAVTVGGLVVALRRPQPQPRPEIPL